MKFNMIWAAPTCIGIGLLLSVVATTSADEDKQDRHTPLGAKATQTPVEEDLHEFMEYVFQPTYKQLKEAMKSAPTDNNGWLNVKSGSLILAEGGNLLMIRGPQDDRDKWVDFAIDVRSSGAKMYRAAHEKDFASARDHYVSMLNSCNACHVKFAKGEHQLTP